MLTSRTNKSTRRIADAVLPARGLAHTRKLFKLIACLRFSMLLGVLILLVGTPARAQCPATELASDVREPLGITKSNQNNLIVTETGMNHLSGAEGHQRRGLKHFEEGQYEKAFAAFKNALALKPDDPVAYNNLGMAYGFMGHPKEAVESFRQAIRIRPDWALPHSNLAATCYNMGLYAEALKSFEQAIRLKSDYARAHNGLGTTYLELGKYEEAIKYFRLASRFDPKMTEPQLNLALANYYLGQTEAAVEHFRKVIKLKPDYAAAYNSLGVTYYLMRRYQEAEEAFAQAFKLVPRSPQPLFNLGMLSLARSDRGAALKHYQALQSLDPPLARRLYESIHQGRLLSLQQSLISTR